MINDIKYKGLQKGDKVTFYVEGKDGSVPEKFEVLRVYPYAEERMGGPFVLDVEGEFHFLKHVEEIYVDAYAGGVPNAHHIYWLADAKVGSVEHDVIREYAYRIGHPDNKVWEHRGERISTEELLGRVAGQRLWALDERY